VAAKRKPRLGSAHRFVRPAIIVIAHPVRLVRSRLRLLGQRRDLRLGNLRVARGVVMTATVTMVSMLARLPSRLSACTAACGQVGLALLLLLGIESGLHLGIGGSQDILCESG